MLEKLVNLEEDLTLDQIKERLEKRRIYVSKTTIQREILKMGYAYKLKKNEIALSEEDRLVRIKWCEENIGRDWSQVIWSDEAGISSELQP